MPGSLARRSLVVVSFTLFIILGTSTGVTGVAWPSLRLDFERPLADLGVLLAVGTVGYFLAGLAAGKLARSFGIGRSLIVILALGSVCLIGYGVVTTWPLLLVCAVGLGFAGGSVDALVNAYVALNHDAKTMGLLHAFFGIGATTGPILVAAVLARGMPWQTGYFVLAAAELVMLVVVIRVRARWTAGGAVVPITEAHFSSFGFAIVALLGVFFLYVGIEITAGQWSYSVLTEGRGFGEFSAGIWVAMYWGGLTAGRLALGFVGDRIRPRRYLQLSMVGTVLGSLLFWVDPLGAGVLGLPLLGYSLAGVFPVLVTQTPGWVGSDNAEAVIGFQIAAASAGTAALPWLAGRVIDEMGLESLGPYLVGLALVMATLNWLLDRMANDQVRLTQP